MARPEERTYPQLLGSLGEKPSVGTECRFVDPTADLAVLASLDPMTFDEDANAFDQLIADTLGDSGKGLAIGKSKVRGPAWLLSLEGRWFPCPPTGRGG